MSNWADEGITDETKTSHYNREEEMKVIMNRTITMAVVVVGLATLAGPYQSAFAVKWEPFKFKGGERYEYAITTNQGGKEKVIEYILDMKPVEGEKDIYEVSYTTKDKIKKADLGQRTAFGPAGGYGMSLSLMIMNPMHTYLFRQLDMKVGEKMSVFGSGVVKITGKEKIGGREGFVCKFYQTQGDEEVLTTEMVIDLKLAMPLRTRAYQKGKLQSQMELTKYTKY